MDLTQSCQNPLVKGSDVKNNLDPGRATMLVFPDTMYTYRDPQGGSKLKTFNFCHRIQSIQTLDALIQRGRGKGARGLEPP